MTRPHPALSAATAVLLCASTALVSANGYHFLHQSAEGMGSAYATNGTAADDISAMFSNPSSIGRFDGTRVSGGAVLDLPRSRLVNASTTAPFSIGLVTVTGTPAEPRQPIDTAFGAAMYLTHEYQPGLVFGVSLTAPYAYVSDYPGTAVSRYTATRTSLSAPNVSPTVAYRVNDQWTVGGGVNLQYYRAALDTQVATSVAPSVETDIESSINGNDIGVGFSLGVEYQATESTRFGVSFRSAIDHSFDGTVELTGSDANRAVSTSLRQPDLAFTVATPRC